MNENKIFPSIVLKFAEAGSSSLTENECMQVERFLEDNYYRMPNSEDVTYLLIRFYNEKKQFQDAKEIGQVFLQENGYSKAVLGELSTTYLARDEMETYFTLVRKHVEEEKAVQKNVAEVIPFPRKKQVLANGSLQEAFFRWNISDQLQFLQNIRFENMDKYIADFRVFLKTEQISPFVQSIIFEILQENQINEEFEVCKLGKKAVFNPVKLPVVEENPFVQTFFSILKESLENDNPSLLMQVTDIAQQHLFLLYPFSFKPKNPNLWAQAYFYWISTLYDSKPLQGALDSEEMHQALAFIEQLEAAQQKNLS